MTAAKSSNCPSLPRQIALANDSIIGSDELSILQYTYSDDFPGQKLAPLFRLLAIEYGPALRDVTLRHAMIAYSSSYLPLLQLRNIQEHHATESRRALNVKLGNPGTIQESDVFAVLLLSWMEWNRGNIADAMVHANGCLLMMNLWSNDSNGREASDLFALVAPFVLFCVDELRCRCSLRGQWTAPIYQLDFGRCVKYQTEFVSRRGRYWRKTTGLFAALDEIQNNQFLLLARCIARITAEPNTEDDQRSIVDDVLKYVLGQMSDPNFNDALATFGVFIHATQPPDIDSNHQSARDYLFNSVKCSQLMVVILEMPTIMQGLKDPRVVSLAQLLGSSFKSGKSRHGVDENYPVVNYNPAQLLLAGLVLQKEKYPDRNIPICKLY